MLYQRLPSWVLGFHGTFEETVDKVLNDRNSHLDASANDYDWLGGGIYFWENDPDRALQFIQERIERKKIRGKTPAVIGAVIDLGLCLNLYDQPALTELNTAYGDFASDMHSLSAPMPKNTGKGTNKDRLLRYLDCAVIEHLHKMRGKMHLPCYDTVRAGFHEGDEVYDGAEFFQKNHIQIAVKNKNCIKGYFLPRIEN